MKRVYLVLIIVGFILPTIFVVIESIETGNIMLYANPKATLDGMFASRITSIFSIDLLFTVLVFLFGRFMKLKNIK